MVLNAFKQIKGVSTLLFDISVRIYSEYVCKIQDIKS